MKNSQNSVTAWLGETGSYIYLFTMLIGFPLFYTNKMFNLYSDKKNFFLFFTFFYTCAVFPSFIKTSYHWCKKRSLSLKPDMVFASVLLLAVLISTIFALDTKKSFFEMSSRTVSGLCFLCCIIVYFAVRKYGRYNGITIWGWLIGSAGIYLFGILCSCGINFMHIQDGLNASDTVIYVTPLSNIDFNTCYVCLVLPPIIIMYMICKERFSQIIHGLNIYMGFLFVHFIKTDSAVIAIAAGLILLGYFALEKENWFHKYLQILGIYLTAKITIRFLLYFFEGKVYLFYGINQLVLKTEWLTVNILCYLLIIILYCWKKDSLRQTILSARKALLCLGITAAFCSIVCVLYVNIRADSISESSFLQKLIIKDETFSGRGYIWKRTISKLWHEPWNRKLFGNGLNCFRDFIASDNYVSSTGRSFADPHNELLQMAVDMGLLGIIGYFGLIISTLVSALKNWRKYELQTAVALTLSIYLLQTLVNGYAIYYLPLLFIFLALANGTSMKE